MRKKLLISFFVISCSFFISGCSQKNTENIDLDQNIIPTNSVPTNIPTMATPSSSTKKQTNIVSIKTKNGEIVIKLYDDKTPNTVATFIKKAESGFYDGLIFHRVIPGFMAQGGDPTGTGTGGGSQKSEINDVPFVRGSIGLARTPASKEISNDSQFFICFTTEGCQHLTGDYVNFGEVISGLDVLDKIVQGDKIISVSTKTK